MNMKLKERLLRGIELATGIQTFNGLRQLRYFSMADLIDSCARQVNCQREQTETAAKKGLG